FDLVLLNHVIEHIADYDTFVSELARILRPGGQLYVRTPNVTLRQGRFWDDYTHVKPYTPLSLDQLMQAHSLASVFMFPRSDHPRISLNIITGGRLRPILFGRVFGDEEIESMYRKPSTTDDEGTSIGR